MKKIYIIVAGIFIAFSGSAQLKSVSFGDQAKASQTIIEVPDFKKMGEQNTSRISVLEPRTMKFKLSKQNGLTVMNRAKNKLPILIKGNPKLELRSGNSPADLGYNFLENAKGLMSIYNPSDEFIVKSEEIDHLGMTHVKFAQVYKGIPIYGAEVIFHKDGKGQFLNGRYVETLDLENVTPSISKEEANELSISDIGGLTKLDQDPLKIFNFERVTSKLIIFEGRLAYHNTVYKNLVDRWEYMVDAHSGEIIEKHASICKFHNHKSEKSCDHNHSIEFTTDIADMSPPPDGPIVTNATDLFGTTKQINAYEASGRFYMIDAARTMFDPANSTIPDDPVGTVWTIDAFDTSPENSNFQYDHVSSTSSSFSGKQTGVSAQFNGGEAYEYFKNVHNRESINGSGGNVIGLINISDQDGSSLGNAFWNGIAMFYGNGDSSFLPLARGLDVAGHEMSHGVVQSTANLQYQGESGALNESFADIFGAMIDREDWLVGEDVVKTSAFPSGALRSLQDPHNGAQTGNFNQGWQPRVYSERFTGPQDNGGVHINSGIPNYAYYLFATSNGVGKDRAEQVYYRALERYLTKSSQFIDARIAVVQAANDLYGASVANAARAAFDEVEVFNGDPTTTQTDVGENPGQDLIIFTTSDQSNLYVADAEGNLIFNPLTEEDPLSVPSVSDDGSEILFINQDKELYYIQVDWTTGAKVQEGVITSNENWRNAVFSRDGLRMAALRDVQNNEIFVYDFISQTGVDYELYNPTFTEGQSAGDVLYADALEFDFSGEFLMYDAFNRIQSTSGSDIEFWDIGFVKVFETGTETFPSETLVEKLFTNLPEGVSVGNPTFAKNSDYVVAFDFLQNNEFQILGSNIETNEVRTIFEGNDRPGYPNYSRLDDNVIFDAASNGQDIIGAAALESNKIESTSASVLLTFPDVGIKWGVWFGNGDRETSVEEYELNKDEMSLFPNPVTNRLTINIFSEDDKEALVTIVDMMGRNVWSKKMDSIKDGSSIDVSSLPSGSYVLSVQSELTVGSKMFVKH